MTPKQTYYFVAASQSFLESEPLAEVLEERTRYYQEHAKPIDFHYLLQPAFLEAPELGEVNQRLNQPTAAVISTDPTFIRWLKLRLAFVEMGEFAAPSESIMDPLQSLPAG